MCSCCCTAGAVAAAAAAAGIQDPNPQPCSLVIQYAAHRAHVLPVSLAARQTLQDGRAVAQPAGAWRSRAYHAADADIRCRCCLRCALSQRSSLLRPPNRGRRRRRRRLLRHLPLHTSNYSPTTDALSRWLKEWTAVPRVVVPEGTEQPTAMAWLRRRGPPLPEAARQRLFRQETVRLFDPATQRVGRVKKDRLLPPGAMLLLPKAAVAEAAAAEQASSASQRAADAAQRRSPAQQAARQAAVAELRSALLRNERDFVALNKSAGLATQGGRNVSLSVDDLMPDAFGGLPGLQRPSDLRLVHRLDRQTTGGWRVLWAACCAASARRAQVQSCQHPVAYVCLPISAAAPVVRCAPPRCHVSTPRMQVCCWWPRAPTQRPRCRLPSGMTAAAATASRKPTGQWWPGTGAAAASTAAAAAAVLAGSSGQAGDAAGCPLPAQSTCRYRAAGTLSSCRRHTPPSECCIKARRWLGWSCGQR